MGTVDFAWSSLILEILDPDPRATTSYLDLTGSDVVD